MAEALDQRKHLVQALIVEQVTGHCNYAHPFWIAVCPVCAHHDSVFPFGLHQEIILPAFSDDFYFFPTAGMVGVGDLGLLVSRVALWGSLFLTSSARTWVRRVGNISILKRIR